MKKQSEKTENMFGGGSKWYREKIIEMVGQIEDEKFLSQIHTILKKHIEKRGG